METPFGTLIGILLRLDEANIFYSVMHVRENAITIAATVPGQRWEIELLSDGDIEIEIFSSDGTIYGKSRLDELIQDFAN